MAKRKTPLKKSHINLLPLKRCTFPLYGVSLIKTFYWYKRKERWTVMEMMQGNNFMSKNLHNATDYTIDEIFLANNKFQENCPIGQYGEPKSNSKNGQTVLETKMLEYCLGVS